MTNTRSTLTRYSFGCVFLAACLSPTVDPEPPPGSGGSGAGTGGSTPAAGSGGSAASAGAGGAVSSGGSAGLVSTGGASTGGASGGGGGVTGGASGAAVGGSSGTAAGGSAGSATGGGAGLSGSSGGSGGSSGAAAGSGGAGQGGGAGASAGSGTSAGTGGAGGAVTSTGCGKSTWPESERYTIDVSGSSREYILKVPDDYDPNRPYRLIFGWHWRGGQASNVSGGQLGGGAYYGLESRAQGSAIFVAPEGLDQGWANTGGRDITFLNAMLARFESELCIDKSRIFSTGFSYGGMMSLAVGCAKGDVFRAIAPISGAFYSGCVDGDHPVAFLGIHGDVDNVVPLADGEDGLAEFVARNHCDATTMPTQPSGCVSYQGCDAGYPVTWCEFSGGHSPPSFSGQAIWDFFSQF